MFCSQCGSTVPETAKFCATCGSSASHDSGATFAGGGPGLDGETVAPQTPVAKTPGVSQPRTSKPVSHPTGTSSSSSDAIGGGGGDLLPVRCSKAAIVSSRLPAEEEWAKSTAPKI
ncbi:MAG: zinc ribbon domain-containing protein [Acidobacteria bacterium]|nr:zinc ribbon domain-containing protein [Acidobacteriota bacterium]